MPRRMVTIDGNEAAAYVAFKLNEVISIYPITPASPMGEWADSWAAMGEKNIWGTVPAVVEMQSEGGAAGAVHGALQSGSLTTTFTASQGLLLMIPNMYKIAGELTSTVFHIAARTVATHALSIFGDHSDVMAARQTGWAMMPSGSVQEAQDFALIAQAATLESRVPFLHFFDGFRTSHEIQKIEKLTEEDMRALVSDDLVRAHRERALSPDHPFIRGTAQNPDHFFQARETVNPYYQACPQIVQKYMDQFARLTGRQYHLFDYVGHPEAERVIVLMGSGTETVEETVKYLLEQGEKVGVVKVRLYRPFSVEAFIRALPSTVQVIAALDRTKEPGSVGEPLYEDVSTALSEARFENYWHLQTLPRVIGGRYGLSSKEFTPAMVKGVFDEMAKERPKNHFTVGIVDDVSQTHIDYDPTFSIEPDNVFRGIFYGLGADGTVSANKNSIKIIGETTDNYAQGYFVYDSKKAGSVTISHLRFGPQPIRAPYLIERANFVACHQFQFLRKYDMLRFAEPGGIFLLNAPYGPDEVWDKLPRSVQEAIINKRLKFFTIDAYRVAREVGLGQRINTIMQTAFFAISNIIPREEAIQKIKDAIVKTYGKRGEEIVQQNFRAVDQALENLHPVSVPDQATSTFDISPPVPDQAPDFVKNVLGKIIAGLGDTLPVSAFPADGTFPSGTAQWEKRNISQEIPVWDEKTCIQCGKCAFVCPHAVIRIKVYDKQYAEAAPEGFKYTLARGREWEPDTYYTIQVSPEDCTGCQLCVEVCPAKNKENTRLKALNMAPQAPILEQEKVNWEYFLSIPEYDRSRLKKDSVKGSQFLRPLFEFSGACAGCGETPYIKLATQLFGDRMIVANATGCSSIYGGNLPTTPWTYNEEGLGPAWSNSLFEDNAEFGLGFRLTIDKQNEFARELLKKLAPKLGDRLVHEILHADQSDEPGIYEQRQRVKVLKQQLEKLDDPDAKMLLSVADFLVKKSVWIIGGDGWAYDIGFGGLDHVLASGRDVNILIMDTEVYSNTGGQNSKATPLGAVAKFAAGGKRTPKKDIALQAIGYGNVYVARVAMGANDTHTVKAFLEAESFPGPSLIVAYSHCIAHGYNLKYGLRQQKLAVDSAYWPLFRYDPRRLEKGESPFILDSRDPKIPFEEYAYNETRYKMLTKIDPMVAKELLKQAQEVVNSRWHLYKQLARTFQPGNGKVQS
ncbi:MAG: pyruvate:ferredoxin (flavodoxin) oxidoreductase [Calditrichaeota bacterium]|nr:pyruvate:ferredoxin (flavodoxin) oxidoreductase [Calditrichota bacterium]